MAKDNEMSLEHPLNSETAFCKTCVERHHSRYVLLHICPVKHKKMLKEENDHLRKELSFWQTELVWAMCLGLTVAFFFTAVLMLSSNNILGFIVYSVFLGLVVFLGGNITNARHRASREFRKSRYPDFDYKLAEKLPSID